MNTSKSSYLAIFAIVALVIAAFTLKLEYSGAGQTTNSNVTNEDKNSPERLLVETKNGRVPEPIPDWFKRVGYQNLKFASPEQMKVTQDMLTARRGADKTPDQLKVLHQLLASDAPFPKKLGVSLLPGLQSPARKEFIPELRKLYAEDPNHQNFRTIVSRWYNSGDKDLVVSLEKDSDAKLAADVKQIVTDIEYPGKDI